jgi:hypothetical protein
MSMSARARMPPVPAAVQATGKVTTLSWRRRFGIGLRAIRHAQLIVTATLMPCAAAQHRIELEGDEAGQKTEQDDIEKFTFHVRPSPAPFLRAPDRKTDLAPTTP